MRRRNVIRVHNNNTQTFIVSTLHTPHQALTKAQAHFTTDKTVNKSPRSLIYTVKLVQMYIIRCWDGVDVPFDQLIINRGTFQTVRKLNTEN